MIHTFNALFAPIGALTILLWCAIIIFGGDVSLSIKRPRIRRPSHTATIKSRASGCLINEPTVIAKRLNTLTTKERTALNDAVSTLYFTDSSKFKGALWSIVHGLLDLDCDEMVEFDEKTWARAMNPDWESS